MSENIKIDVHHITRVEGHGNIVVDVKEGKVNKLNGRCPKHLDFLKQWL